MKPKGKVKRTWTSELAYAVGLLASDGNLSPDGRHINFTSKDLDQVVAFKKCLGLQNAIGRKSRCSEQQKKYFVVQFGDVLFYRWLLNTGLSPRKSKVLGTLKIPEKYFFDFLRGNFDGDGSVNAYWDPRWESSYMYYLRFSSGSSSYLEWLRKVIKKLCKAEGKIRLNGRAYELIFSKKAARTVFKELYYADHIPSLKRKHLKVSQILEIDSAHHRAQVEKLVDSPA